LARAEEHAREGEALTTRIDALQADADALLAAVPPHAPAVEKAAGWAKEDAARALRDRRTVLRAERLHVLRTALNLTPDLVEARQQLATHHRAEAEAAEARRDPATAAAHLHALGTYDDGTHAAWLAGKATVRIETAPPGLAMQISGWRTLGRRLVPARSTRNVITPATVELAAGAWLLRVGSLPVPIRLARAEHQMVHVSVPAAGVLHSGWCYVPGGAFEAGGDANAPDSFERTSVDVPGFVIRRDPITNAEYIEFLDALVQAGDPDAAARWAPREPASGSHQPVYARTAEGGFAVGTDAEGVVWSLNEPVVQITWQAAMAWCAWAAERDGVPWRLPHELEWEKAARGPDGRYYPWGDAFDPAFGRMLQSTAGKPGRCAVDAYSTDVSPYGVRGMGGNVRDMCLNPWERGAPPRRLVVEHPAGDDRRLRSTRGGSFYSQPHFCRAATRFAGPVDQGFASVGFRPCFSWPSE
jgi:serine/threonine-protein kinase